MVSIDDCLDPVNEDVSSISPNAGNTAPSDETPTLTTSASPPSSEQTVIDAQPISEPTSPNTATPVHESDASASPGLPELLGHDHRQRKPSVLLKNYVTNTSHLLITPSLTSSPASLESSTTGPGNVLYPISNYVSDAHYSPSHHAFLAAVTTGVEPQRYKEAIKDKVWRNSLHDEYTSMEVNRVWDVTHLPPEKKVISCQWIHKIKYNSNGTISRHKSRLVACGNRQKEGVDYKETFAPVAKLNTVHVFLEITAANQ